MKKIIMLFLVTFSFTQDITTKQIIVPIDNNTVSVNINDYVTLVSGYYNIEAIFMDNYSTNLSEHDGIQISSNFDDFRSNIEVGYYQGDGAGEVDGCYIHDPHLTISYQSPTITPEFGWLNDDNPNLNMSFDLVLRVSGVFDDSQMGVDDNSNNIYGYSLDNPYPNPFNPNTTISFTIPIYDFVSIKVYDVMGRLVSTLAEEKFNSGTHTLIWNGENYSSGEYFIKMKSSNYNKTKIVTLIK
tara:strand:- start:4515 stop:5240 length:726 start_codon:yes stop_codon:yes gene_type:complete